MHPLINELATRRLDLEKGYVVLLLPNSSAASDSPSIRIISGPVEGAKGIESAERRVFDQPDEEEVRRHADDVRALERLEELASTVDSIGHRLAAIDRQLERPPWPAKFRNLQARVRAVVTAKPRSENPRWLGQPRQEFMDKLRAKGFVVSDETVARIWTGLQSARVVVLQGAPGTGKSMLAKLLPEVLLPPFGERSRTFVRMDKDMSYEIAIGGDHVPHRRAARR